MKDNTRHGLFFRLVFWACLLVFLGRGWQHIFWDAPFRALLWDENLMSRPIQWIFGFEWDQYLKHPHSDQTIQGLISITGVFYILCFFMTLFYKKWKRAKFVLLFGAAALAFLAFLYCKEKFYTIAQFFEYSLQFSTPVFFYFMLKGVEKGKLIFWMKVAIALTFASHGLYALGIYPIPGYFVQMIMDILPIDQEASLAVLHTAGALDLVLAVLIFFSPKIARPTLLYAAFWGLLTALARVVAHVEWQQLAWTLHHWLPETVYRTPHFLIPLAVYVILRDKTS